MLRYKKKQINRFKTIVPSGGGKTSIFAMPIELNSLLDTIIIIDPKNDMREYASVMKSFMIMDHLDGCSYNSLTGKITQKKCNLDKNKTKNLKSEAI